MTEELRAKKVDGKLVPVPDIKFIEAAMFFLDAAQVQREFFWYIRDCRWMQGQENEGDLRSSGIIEKKTSAFLDIIREENSKEKEQIALSSADNTPQGGRTDVSDKN